MLKQPALRHRDFRLLWLGQTLARLGSSAFTLVAALTVLETTNSARAVAALPAAAIVPQVVLLLIGGLAADTLPKRRLLVSTDTLAAATLGILVLLGIRGDLGFLPLLTATATLGVLRAFFEPTYRAFIAELVGEDELSNANALVSLSSNLGTVTGPAIGGLLFSLGGSTAAFALTGSCFLVAATASAFLRSTGRGRVGARLKGSPRETLAAVVAGARYVKHHRWLRMVIGTTALANVVAMASYLVALPVISGAEASGGLLLGTCYAFQAGAAILCSLALGRRKSFKRPLSVYLMFCGLGGLGVAVVGLLAPFGWALIVGSVIVGASMAVEVVEQWIFQTWVPRDMLGRVFSINLVCSFALLPIGFVLAGALVSATSAPAVAIAAGLIVLVATAAAVPAGRGAPRTAAAAAAGSVAPASPDGQQPEPVAAE